MKQLFVCTANLHMADQKRTRCFTASKQYEGELLEDGSIEFIDDQSQHHQVTDDWLQFFEKVD